RVCRQKRLNFETKTWKQLHGILEKASLKLLFGERATASKPIISRGPTVNESATQQYYSQVWTHCALRVTQPGRLKSHCRRMMRRRERRSFWLQTGVLRRLRIRTTAILSLSQT